MAITSYATLKAELADALNRTDLVTATAQRTALSLSDGVIVLLIANAENRLRRDIRCRKLQEVAPFSVSADNKELPSDFGSLQALYHDGTGYFDPINIVPGDALPGLKSRFGITGVPAYASVVDDNLRFAPEPNTTFSLKLQYWVKLTALSASNTTNWLLNDHPDIYYYASLMESAPYLVDDDRLPMWDAMVEKRLNELDTMNWTQQWSGSMRQTFTPIG